MDNNNSNDIDIKIDNKSNEPEIKVTNKKMIFLNFLLIITIFVGLFIYMINVDGLSNILQLLKSVDYKWVFAGIGCLILLWFFDALCLHIPLKKLYPNQTFFNSIKVTMIGQLFNNVTPFSSGGQPMQAYELTKTGKKASDSFSVLAMKFIITQMALVIFTLLVVIFKFDFFLNLFKDYIWIAILGFLINIIAIIVTIIIGIKPRIITFIINPIIKLLGKIKLLKKSDEKIEKLNNGTINFNNQFKKMNTQKLVVFKTFICATLQSLAYYSITYMVYRAFGNFGIDFWEIIPAQAFLLLIMTFVPTPGSGIGAEGGFLLLFSSIFKEGTINMSILFWRVYTFYLPIIIGALFLIPTKFKQENINKKI